MKPCELSAILLAGGCSSRMGQPKAAMVLGGKTLLQHQVEKLRTLGITEILVSGWKDCPPGTEFIPDLYPHKGPLSGIHAGLCRIRNSAALVLPVDMPLIHPDTLQELAACHGAFPITVLEKDGFPEPLAGIYDKALAADCEHILQGDRYSPRQLFFRAGILPIPYTGDPARLMNCNTPEEFRQMAQIYAAQQKEAR